MFLFKDEARYSCDEGFTLVGVGLVTCQASGRWSGEIIFNFLLNNFLAVQRQIFALQQCSDNNIYTNAIYKYLITFGS